MKNIRNIILALSGLLMGACNALELGPIDQYSINNYWNTEEQCERFMIGLHYRLKEKMETIMVMGELRGGTLSTEAVTSTGEAASNLEAVSNNLSVSNPCLTNWGDFYMDIYQINHAIEKISGECDFLRDETRKTYLGQLYGLRAFYYFHLLRTWGGVPLCDKPDVLQTGDLTTLNKKRASEQETWNFIRKDIDTSCDMYAGLAYGNYNGANCYWNKAASQCLKAEVYLWGAKVKPIGGTGVLSPDPAGDLQAAKEALEEVEPHYSYNAKFADAFSPKNKDANPETIFAARYMLNESTNYFVNFTYNIAIFTKYFDAEGNKLGNVLNIGSGYMRYEYSKEFYDSFEEGDTRRDATFLQFYLKDTDDALYAAGRSLRKFLGDVSNGKVQYTNDVPVYRYMDVALMLAEICNELDEPGDTKKWIDIVRKRAFGKDQPFTYTDKEAAEEAILRERRAEFVAESKCWYDVRRMCGGKYALELVGGDERRLLWPIDSGVLSKDPLVEQNEAYK